MTYLDLINNVLRRLREDTVDTVNGTDYSSLIGDLVNDAKKIVENSFDWTALRPVQASHSSLIHTDDLEKLDLQQ